MNKGQSSSGQRVYLNVISKGYHPMKRWEPGSDGLVFVLVEHPRARQEMILPIQAVEEAAPYLEPPFAHFPGVMRFTSRTHGRLPSSSRKRPMRNARTPRPRKIRGAGRKTGRRAQVPEGVRPNSSQRANRLSI